MPLRNEYEDLQILSDTSSITQDKKFRTYSEKDRILGFDEITFTTRSKNFAKSYWKYMAAILISVVSMILITKIFKGKK